MDPSLAADVARAASRLRSAKTIVALTGAGISVESGIPDFRGEGGLWTEYPPEEYATIDAFLASPEKAWGLYRALGRCLSGRRPNAAHLALAELEAAGRLAAVVTQNVDGLHQAAGSRETIEMHGNSRLLHCLGCDHGSAFEERWLVTDVAVPKCDRCRSPLKPDVVLFGEDVRDGEEVEAWIGSCDALLVVGTSARVWPAAGYPGAVVARGGVVVECNPEPVLDPGSVLGLAGPAASIVPALVAEVLGQVA